MSTWSETLVAPKPNSTAHADLSRKGGHHAQAEKPHEKLEKYAVPILKFRPSCGDGQHVLRLQIPPAPPENPPEAGPVAKVDLTGVEPGWSRFFRSLAIVYSIICLFQQKKITPAQFQWAFNLLRATEALHERMVRKL